MKQYPHMNNQLFVGCCEQAAREGIHVNVMFYAKNMILILTDTKGSLEMICFQLDQLLIHHDNSSRTEMHKCRFTQNMDRRFCLSFIVTAQGRDIRLWPISH